jgi:hypothetical protein
LLEFNSEKEELMFRNIPTHVIAASVLALGSLFWIGCNGDKEKEQPVNVSSLPDLPQEDAAKLKAVPDQPMLATSEVHLLPNALPDNAAVHPNCAAHDVETDYNAKVSYPITVCTFPVGVPTGTGVFSPNFGAPTNKLENAKLSAEQRGAVPSSPELFWCRTSRGPWQGYLRSEHGCAGTCDTQNKLTLTNTPNLVEFDWVGLVTSHPPGFDFVGKLDLIGTVDNGPCHPQNALPGKAH